MTNSGALSQKGDPDSIQCSFCGTSIFFQLEVGIRTLQEILHLHKHPHFTEKEAEIQRGHLTF